ncbi:MAG: phosphoketolase family protein, partial [Chloroflexia bacterium]|nr:phosphoketolase family protein [Chloroflexia bacterium]
MTISTLATASISAYGPARATVQGAPLNAEELRKLHAYWQASCYLAAGMIYLRDNPLLSQPLTEAHVKKRLLGHWGSSPGQAFIWVHLNRVIKKYDLNMIYLSGPGHGVPGVLAPVYLEGTYSETYPDKSEDAAGMVKFFKQFSFPGGIGSHCTPETPGSIHEGGELGYSLSHGYGTVFDNPDLISAVVVGDGEAETGPLATAWHSNKFLNPARDGAVLPILHLNGYKINNPTILARISHEDLTHLFVGYGYQPYFVEGSDPESMHQAMSATLDRCVEDIQHIRAVARSGGAATLPRYPMIILRTPKGWTAPEEVDGRKLEGFWRSHQVPLSGIHNNPENLRILEQWLRSYHPETAFDANGKLVAELRELAPQGQRRMSANPHANGGLLRKDLNMPDFHRYGIDIGKPGQIEVQGFNVGDVNAIPGGGFVYINGRIINTGTSLDGKINSVGGAGKVTIANPTTYQMSVGSVRTSPPGSSTVPTSVVVIIDNNFANDVGQKVYTYTPGVGVRKYVGMAYDLQTRLVDSANNPLSTSWGEPLYKAINYKDIIATVTPTTTPGTQVTYEPMARQRWEWVMQAGVTRVPPTTQTSPLWSSDVGRYTLGPGIAVQATPNWTWKTNNAAGQTLTSPFAYKQANNSYSSSPYGQVVTDSSITGDFSQEISGSFDRFVTFSYVTFNGYTTGNVPDPSWWISKDDWYTWTHKQRTFPTSRQRITALVDVPGSPWIAATEAWADQVLLIDRVANRLAATLPV